MRAPGAATEDVLDTAVAWAVQLTSGEASEADHAACVAWRARDPAHERAWQRIAHLTQTLAEVPPALGMAVLGRRTSGAGRRRALLALGSGLGVAALGWAGHDTVTWRRWTATHRTAVGEQRLVVLDDGSRLLLDTDSAVDVAWQPSVRRVVLLAGQIRVETAPDHWQPPRAFVVQTAVGQLTALGTRFLVHDDGEAITVGVLEGAVAFQPRLAGAGGPITLQAGESARCDAHGLQARAPLPAHAATWTQGTLVADAMPLADFIAALARYRQGQLRCAPEVATLRVSGAFPLADTDRVLAALAQVLPVRIERFTRYWTTVRAV